ncbi:AT-rich interactive domain-containing protein 3A-like isoform X1 [Denticeps clupeoides]|uniref:AT-rich interactive domain-containing protein 3 n=2 Tax=Denticeps clupeoides TaxID=299321 RepID=A0AAY4D6Y8_9TELE|nr:AT-rich interactive domain-containing protein 3A-like isoform X1 [Denticeps clupeoides]
MVENSGSGKAQMTSLSQEGGLGGFSQAGFGGPAGMKLEAVMEQLQKQQQAKLEMERKERHLREAHILYAQQVAAQQAIMASARAQGGPLLPDFYGKGSIEKALKASHLHPNTTASTQGGISSARDGEDEDARGDGREREGGSEGEDDEEDEMMEGEEASEEENEGLEFLRKQSLALQQGPAGVPPLYPYPVYSASPSAAKKRPRSPSTKVKDEPEDKSPSPTGPPAFSTPNGLGDWSFEESFKQNGNGSWTEDGEGGKGKGEASRDFAKLYELDSDPNRKEFLDDLFTFMQKRGTPVNRIPIMAKQVLDLYMLYKLVTEKGGLVEVINKKIWREITKGLNLPTSITSAAFTLRTQYMKYLYPYECEKKGLSSPGELQAAIDSNRREGRRPSYSNSLYRFSPSPNAAPHILASPKMQMSSAGQPGLQATPSAAIKKSAVPEEGPVSVLPGRLPLALALGHQQQLARAATLEQLREHLETGMGAGVLGTAVGAIDGPDRKMARVAEEQQRLLQQAFQQNLLAMASQVHPANLRMGSTREDKQDLALNISSNGSTSITVSVEVNGTVYSGTLYAQKPSASASATATPTGQGVGHGINSSSHSPTVVSSSSSSSSKCPGSADATSSSP